MKIKYLFIFDGNKLYYLYVYLKDFAEIFGFIVLSIENNFINFNLVIKFIS